MNCNLKIIAILGTFNILISDIINLISDEANF